MGADDVPLLKLFEFLTASMCLYVIEDRPSASAATGVWADDANSTRCVERFMPCACSLEVLGLASPQPMHLS